MHEASALIAAARWRRRGRSPRDGPSAPSTSPAACTTRWPTAPRASASTTTARIAISWLLDHGFERIAYVDVDVHHGDGVQAAFYDDPRVLTISLHQDPRTLFPGTGLAHRDRRGRRPRAPRSTCRCRPAPATPAGCARSTRSCRALLRAFRPEVLVTQCGGDTHREDPLANLELSVDGHRAIYRSCASWPRTSRAAGAGSPSAAAGTAWSAVRAADLDPPARHRAGPRRDPAHPDPGGLDRARRAARTDRRAARPTMTDGREHRAPAVGPGAAELARPPSLATRRGRSSRCTASTRTTRVTDVTEHIAAPPTPRRRRGRALPAHWEADVVAADGGIVHLRPIRPRDADALVAFHARLSDRTRYLRYFRPTRASRRATSSGSPTSTTTTAWRSSPCSAARSSRSAGTRAAGPRNATTAEVAFVVARRPTRAAASARSCSSTSPPPPGRRGMTPVQRRGAGARTAPWCGCSATPATRSAASSPTARSHLEFDIDADRRLARRCATREQRAEARVDRARLLRPASVAVIGATNEPAQDRPRGPAATCCAAASPARSTRSTRRRARCSGVRAYPSVLDIPDAVDLAVVAVPAASVAEVVELVPREGRHGAGRGHRRVRRAWRRGRASRRRAAARRGGPRATACGWSARTASAWSTPTRRCGSTPSLAPVLPLHGPGRVLLPVRRARRRDPRRGAPAAASACRRSSRPATAPTSPATTCCSSGRPTGAPTWCCCTWRSFGNPRKFARLARRLGRHQADRRGEERDGTRAPVAGLPPTPAGRRRRTACGRCSSSPASSGSTRSATCSTSRCC